MSQDSVWYLSPGRVCHEKAAMHVLIRVFLEATVGCIFIRVYVARGLMDPLCMSQVACPDKSVY